VVSGELIGSETQPAGSHSLGGQQEIEVPPWREESAIDARACYGDATPMRRASRKAKVISIQSILCASRCTLG
jgi:hypothetical protein